MALLVIAGLPAAAVAKQELLSWDDLSTGRLYSTYLEAEHPVTLELSALATFDRETWRPIAYPWILDARTRKVRWTVDPDAQGTRVQRRGGALRAAVRDDTLDLAAGQYEIYFATCGDRYRDLPLSKLWDSLDNWLKKRQFDMRDQWHLVITCEDDDAGAITVGYQARPEFEALARIPHPGDSAHETVLFKLDAPVEVLLYAIGEYDRDARQFVDAGWILDAQTRQPVWEMSRRNTRAAGGAAKNRRFRGFVPLAAGTYVMGYSSDDSHSYGDWNVNPPSDPEFWGIALFDPRGDVTPHWTSPVEDPFRATMLVELDRQRDTTFSQQGLRVRAPVNVRVVAIGEYDDSDDRFADFGWIENAATEEPVWRMTKHNTRPAGGSAKNRMADETIALAAGDYIIGYVTDGSHAYGDWNAAPPRNPELWGIRVSALGDQVDRDRLETFDPGEQPDMLVDLTAVGDDQHVEQRFTIDQPATVRILSLGEGLRGHLFDYGWIRRLGDGDHQGRMVWKAYYENSRPAGGAEKNRELEETIELEPGRYEAHYVTDDSHSFEDWNATPPDRPYLWGIRVRRLGP